MPTPDRPSCTYAIDASDTISFVSKSWLVFARSNGAANLTRSNVVGRTLWDFVVGDRVRHLYELLLDRVRAVDAPILLPFRCDSPSCRRYMRLVMEHVVEGTVRFDGILVRSEPRPRVAVLDMTARRSARTIPFCSYCLRLRAGEEEWLEAEDAIVRLGLLEEPAPPRLDHGVCPACEALIRGELLTDDVA